MTENKAMTDERLQEGERFFYQQSVEFSRKYGSSWQANAHTRYGFVRRRRLYKRVLRDVLPQSLRCSSVSFLDSGCGNGSMSVCFRENLQIHRLDGIDFVPEQAQCARDQFHYDEAKCGNVLDVDSAFSEKYDIVNSAEVYLCIAPEHRKRFWAAHLSMISPGGRMILVVPNLRSLMRRFRPHRNAYPSDLTVIREELALFLDYEIESISGVDLFLKRVLTFRPHQPERWKDWLTFEFCIVLRRGGETGARDG